MLLITAFCLFLFLSASYGAEQDVLEFSDSDFSTKIAEHETLLVMFYAPW